MNGCGWTCVFWGWSDSKSQNKTASISLEQGQNDRLMRRVQASVVTEEETDKRTLLEGVKGICR